MTRFILGLVLMSVGSLTFAQSGKLKKADELYNKIAYAEAATYYSELIGSEVDNVVLRAKLADCYYQIGESESAERYYGEVVNSSEAKAIDIYNYAQSLKENGKYQESDQWMAKYYDLQASDLRAKEFSQNRTYLDKIESRGSFFSIQHLKINTANSEFGGYMLNDDQVYFISNRTKRAFVKRSNLYDGKRFLDLFVGNVSDNNEITSPELMSRKINRKFHEGPLCFSPDKKTVYFTRNNMSSGNKRRDQKGIQNLKIYKANVNESGKWVDIIELPVNSKEYSVGHPSVSSDGKLLYFASDMPGGYGGADIYVMEIKGDGTFGAPKNLGPDINTEGQEMFPWIDKQGQLFIASDGHVGLGGLDVFVFMPQENGFGEIMNLGAPLNSSKDDFAFIMKDDGVNGYFSSNRTSGNGNDDIYSFILNKPLEIQLVLDGLVVDKNSKEILEGALVQLYDAEGEIISNAVTGADGRYTFDVEPDASYSLKVQKNNYYDGEYSASTIDIEDGVSQITTELGLEKDPGLSLYTLITDAKSGDPLNGVSIVIVDNFTNKEFGSTVTKESGDFMAGIRDKKINDRVSYNIILSKEGYFPKTVTFNHQILKGGVINVHEFLDGQLTLDAAVTDLTELVQINPINFDLNKYAIRPDAAKELDKIVEVMNKYPDLVVELGAHTDCRGSKSYNERLSDKRAKSSAAYIKERITNPDRIYGKGYGESRLLNGCECEGSVKSTCSEEEHSENRRTEFKVISNGSSDVQIKNTSTDSFDD